MKFLKLTVINAEGERSEYNLTEAGAELDREKVLSAIGDALFGNEAIFAGSTELTVNYENETYVLKRDFTSAQEFRLYLGGKTIPQPQAQEIIDNIAGLSDKKWRLNAASVDVDEFVADPVSYTEQFLASLGFDREELEKKGDAKESLRNITAAQADAIKALGGEFDEEELTTARANFEKANENLEYAVEASKKYAAELSAADKKKKVEAELAALKENEKKIAELRATLDENAENQANVSAFETMQELNSENEKIEAELESLSAEIAETEGKIDEISKKIDENAASREEFAKAIKSLSDEFARIITENAEKGELTAAALSKATDGEFEKFEEELAALEEWNKKYTELADKLAATRVTADRRNFVRTGMALETALFEKTERLEATKKLLEDKRTYLEKLETELADSQNLYENKDAARIAKADERRMKLLRYKILCHTLQVDISSAESKIRANTETKQSFAEDITALTRAKNAINDYVAKLESRNAKISDKLINIKARLTFFKDVDDLEYGIECPVCKGRIVDKIEIAKDKTKASDTYEKYNSELIKNRAILTEYYAKLEKIDTRLGQLKERDVLCNSYLESLNVTVGAKQTALTGILKDSEANSVPTLEKNCDEANAAYARMSAAGVDGAFLREHIGFVEKELERIKTGVTELGTTVENLEHDVSMTDEANNTIMAVNLDGHSAYELLDQLTKSEKSEDALYKELAEAEKNRAAHLAFVMKTEKSAPQFINAATEILSGAVTEIKQVESALNAATEENKNLEAALAEQKTKLDEKTARHKELSATSASIIDKQNELYKNTDVAQIDEESAQRLKVNLMTEQDVASATKEIEAYTTATEALEAELTALGKDSTVDADSVPDPKKAKEEYDEALKNLLAVRERQTLNEATKNATNVKLSMCVKLAEQAHRLKKLAAGEVTEVILPIINDVFNLSGGDCVAAADGSNGLTFTKNNGTSIKSVNADRLTVAVNAALNQVLKLATGTETVKFATVDKPQNVEEAATKYGILFL